MKESARRRVDAGVRFEGAVFDLGAKLLDSLELIVGKGGSG